jgi:hypothetical protein
VIFDELQHRVFAARDAAGAQPLYWCAAAPTSTKAWPRFGRRLSGARNLLDVLGLHCA